MSHAGKEKDNVVWIEITALDDPCVYATKCSIARARHDVCDPCRARRLLFVQPCKCVPRKEGVDVEGWKRMDSHNDVAVTYTAQSTPLPHQLLLSTPARSAVGYVWSQDSCVQRAHHIFGGLG